MKKTISITGFLLFLALSTFAQIRNFTLFPWRVSVTGSTITSPAATLPGFSSSDNTNYINGNGVYQENGSTTPLFTIRDFSIFNAAGVLSGTLPTYSEFTNLHNEIAIVPAPGTVRKYYVIYTLYSYLSWEQQGNTVTMVAKVNAQNPSSIIIESTSPVNPSAPVITGISGELAVSKRNSAGNHDLYVLWKDRVKKFSITAAGILHQSDLGVGLVAQTYHSHELELSNDNAYLAWSDGTKLVRMTSGGTNLVSTNFSDAAIIGVEFHSSNSNIIFTTTDSEFIKRVDFSSSPAIVTNIALPPSTVPGMNSSSYSQLEQGGFNRIFGILSNGSDYRLYYFDQSSISLPIVVTQIVPNTGHGMNDQIDGEDYYNFVPTPSITFTLNGSASQGFIPVTFDGPVTVTATTNTTETTYFVSMMKVNLDKSSAGTEYGQWYNGAPGTINMNAFYTSKTNVSIIPPGNYKIKLANGGGADWAETSKFITVGCTATPSFTVNGSSALGFIPVSYNGAVTVDATACKGETSYFVAVMAVNQNMSSAGPEYTQWYTGAAGVIDAKAFYLSKSGYAAMPAGYYKIKVAVTNDGSGGCTGWSEAAKYIQIQSGARASELDLDEDENISAVIIHPNPVAEVLNIKIEKKNSVDDIASLQLFNLHGEEVYHNGLSINKEYSLPLYIPAGLYTAVITEMNGNVRTVRILKTGE